MRRVVIPVLAFVSMIAFLGLAIAGDAATPAAEAVNTGTKPVEEVLTAEEKAEREARKACKVALCQAFHSVPANAGEVDCDVVKSWRKEQLGKLVNKLKVSWPYGAVRCSTAVKVKSAALSTALTADKADVVLEKHTVACRVEREKEEPATINFDFKPTVKFEKGKAVTAKINWGKVEAPTLIKTALWTATAADNTVNILSSTLVEDINDFVGKKCDEVKTDWKKQ